jgi:Holliday junction DNA helicase RuvA
MIAHLEGQILVAEAGRVILDVGGVGFAVHVPLSLTARAGERLSLYTYLHVRENELALYGFHEEDDKALFELLLGVSGVGPKAAMSLMSVLSVDTLRRAILNQQPEVLSRARRASGKRRRRRLCCTSRTSSSGRSAPSLKWPRTTPT